MPKAVEAKWPDYCRACLGAISKGDAIVWKQHYGVKHLRCQFKKAVR